MQGTETYNYNMKCRCSNRSIYQIFPEKGQAYVFLYVIYKKSSGEWVMEELCLEDEEVK